MRMLARQAEVRPAPPQRLYQAFIAEDAQVVEIRGDPDQGQCASPRRKGSVPIRNRTELSEEDERLRLSKNDPIAQELVEVVHAGEVERLRELLGQHPGLGSVRIVDDKGGSGTALHAATDWPGFFPRARRSSGC